MEHEIYHLLQHVAHNVKDIGVVVNALAQKLLVDDPALAAVVLKMQQSGAAVEALLTAKK